MFNSVQLVRDLCKERSIPIAKLEKDCGFSNGYLNPKKMSKIPYDRAVIIAEYLGVSTNLILTGEDESKKMPTVSSERDILDEVDIGFYKGFKELTEEQKETVRDMVMLMRQRRDKQEE